MRVPIFISRPNPFTYEQKYFLEKLLSILEEKYFENITLQAKDYNPYESLNCLNELIKRCYGIIIVSYGQTFIEIGSYKKGAINDNCFFESEEREMNNTWITSPFCQIEGTLAFNNNLPMLILAQENIKKDGILKEGIHASFSPSFCLDSINLIDEFFSSEDFRDVFDLWEEKVLTKYKFVNNQKI